MASLEKLNFPEYIKELDHDWHEFHSLENTEENSNDQNNRDIVVFIEHLQCAVEI